jgi:YceI-like domain
MKMKKITFLVLSLLVANVAIAQKMMTKAGEIKFEATMPALEEIAAKNNTVSCIFDQATSEFAVLGLMKAFKFKVPLMEEHFNENYVESTKYPKTTFKGKVANFDSKKLTSTKTAYDIEGDLTIHGVTKKVKTKINLALVGGKILATSTFTIKIEDYKIEVPSLVKEKIAKDAKVALNFSLEGK